MCYYGIATFYSSALTCIPLGSRQRIHRECTALALRCSIAPLGRVLAFVIKVHVQGRKDMSIIGLVPYQQSTHVYMALPCTWNALFLYKDYHMLLHIILFLWSSLLTLPLIFRRSSVISLVLRPFLLREWSPYSTAYSKKRPHPLCTFTLRYVPL